MIEIWVKSHLVSDHNCNIVTLLCPKKIRKEWQTMLGSHRVLVALHGRFTINIEQGN